MKNLDNRGVAQLFLVLSVIVLVGIAGAYYLVSTKAATKADEATQTAAKPQGAKSSSATCNLPAETKLGSYYTGIISNIPSSSVMNLYATFGDGTQKVAPFQWESTVNLQYYDIGNWDGTGSKATILGPTQIKLTGPTRNNDKSTQILATCSTTVVN